MTQGHANHPSTDAVAKGEIAGKPKMFKGHQDNPHTRLHKNLKHCEIIYDGEIDQLDMVGYTSYYNDQMLYSYSQVHRSFGSRILIYIIQKVVELGIEKTTFMNMWSRCRGYLTTLVDFQTYRFQAASPVPVT